MTAPPPPHDPYGQPSPAPQGDWAQPSPAPQNPTIGSSTPQGAWGQPSPAGAGYPAPAAGQPAPGGPAPGSDLGADLGAALTFAGHALLRNPVAYLVTGLIYCVIYLVLIGGGLGVGIALMIPQLDNAATSDAAEFGAVMTLYGALLVGALLTVPFALLWQSGAARAAGTILESGRPSIGQALVGPMRVLLTALLYGVIVLVGTILLYIPGLIAAVLFMFAVPAALRGASPVDALKESYALVRANLGSAVVAYLVLMVITSIASTLVLPALVLTPFMVLFEVGMYERLKGHHLPEVAKA